MPPDVRQAWNIVAEYFLGRTMENDVFDGETENEEQQEGADIKSVFLDAMMNPLANANRYLQLEALREKTGAIRDDTDDWTGGTSCDFGWFPTIDGKCAKFIEGDFTKNGAKSLCLAKNAEVIKPEKKSENAALGAYLWDAGFDGCVWLGISDSRNEGTFEFDNSNEEVAYQEFAEFSRKNNRNRNLVYYQSKTEWKDKQRWNLANDDEKCSTMCVKDVGDRHKLNSAVVDPASNVNRFLTLGELDDYYAVIEKRLKNGEEVCNQGWKLVGNNCVMYQPNVDFKKSHKIECVKLGAKLFAPANKTEQDQILGYLDLMIEEEVSQIWLGINDGKSEGYFVVDNVKTPVTWTNFDQFVKNSEERNSVVMDYETGLWSFVSALDTASAVCVKPLLPQA